MAEDCEADWARPAQPMDHSIGKTGMPDMPEPEPARIRVTPNPLEPKLIEQPRIGCTRAPASKRGRPGEISGLVARHPAMEQNGEDGADELRTYEAGCVHRTNAGEGVRHGSRDRDDGIGERRGGGKPVGGRDIERDRSRNGFRLMA